MAKNDSNKKLICLYSAILFSVLFLFYLSNQYNDINLHLNTEKAVPFVTPWTIEDTGTKQELELPVNLDVPAGYDFTITNTLPKNLVEGSSICVRTSWQSIRLYLDQELLYENGTDTSLYLGKAIGSNWNIVRIPRGNADKEIKIVLNSPYKAFSGIIHPIVYGSKSSLLFYILQQQLFGFLIFILIFLLSISLLLSYFIIKLRKEKNQNILYLSLFSFLFSVWLLSESRMLQFFTGNQVLISIPAFLSLHLLPLPLLLYLNSVYQSHHKNRITILFWMYFANFIANIMLQIFQIRDFFENTSISNLLLIIGIVVIFIDCFIEAFHYKNKEALHFFKTLCIFFFFAILELISFYQGDYLNVSRYIRIGFLVFILLLTNDTISKVQKMAASKKEAEYYEKLAYTDLLTKGKNRTAYTKDMVDLIENGTILNLCLILFDVNNLKQINDTYGHIQGDDAIQNAYNCIHDIFGRLGTCYRMGGDEFVCVIEDADKSNIDCLLDDFNKKVLTIGKTTKYVFKIAVGYDMLTARLDMDSLEKLYNSADAKMYQNKKIQKSGL